MNKIIILFCLALILTTLTACGSVAQAATPMLPKTIQDPLLLDAWIHLNSYQEPIRLWDGSSLSGHDLAQFVLDHHIPIVWDFEKFCGGGSCSRKFCLGDLCTYTGGRPRVAPIYISPLPQDREVIKLDNLVGTLAHEIYHRTQPNGTVEDTLYEEYSAYYVGASMSKQGWMNSENYNPMQPACLELWFNDHHLQDVYKGLNAYPQSVVPIVENSSITCKPGKGRTSQAASGGLQSCTLNVEGSANCQSSPKPTPAPEYRLVCTTYPGGLKGCETIWLEDESSLKAATQIP
ncbi:MAG: hypothetical protein ACM3PY_09700 [Omnitrophica WOR_2 bacterium]